jgi:hypothetical protein
MFFNVLGFKFYVDNSKSWCCVQIRLHDISMEKDNMSLVHTRGARIPKWNQLDVESHLCKKWCHCRRL